MISLFAFACLLHLFDGAKLVQVCERCLCESRSTEKFKPKQTDGSLGICMQHAMRAGKKYFSFNHNKGACFIPVGDEEESCITNLQTGRSKKHATYRILNKECTSGTDKIEDNVRCNSMGRTEDLTDMTKAGCEMAAMSLNSWYYNWNPTTMDCEIPLGNETHNNPLVQCTTEGSGWEFYRYNFCPCLSSEPVRVRKKCAGAVDVYQGIDIETCRTYAVNARKQYFSFKWKNDRCEVPRNDAQNDCVERTESAAETTIYKVENCFGPIPVCEDGSDASCCYGYFGCMSGSFRDYCCNGQQYCTYDDPQYAAEMGFAMCPTCQTRSELPDGFTWLEDDTDVTFDTACVFPFTYQEMTYWDCTNVMESNPENYWCDTSADGSTWGYCDMDMCSTSSGPMACQTTAEYPDGATVIEGESTVTFNGLAFSINTPCMFPFEYDAQVHYACTNNRQDDPENYWCYTATDRSTWGYCIQDTCAQCQTTAVLPDGATEDESDRGTLSFGKPCVFPFTFEGTTFAQCTNLHEDNSNNYWCYTAEDLSTWGYCDYTCDKPPEWVNN